MAPMNSSAATLAVRSDIRVISLIGFALVWAGLAVLSLTSGPVLGAPEAPRYRTAVFGSGSRGIRYHAASSAAISPASSSMSTAAPTPFSTAQSASVPVYSHPVSVGG